MDGARGLAYLYEIRRENYCILKCCKIRYQRTNILSTYQLTQNKKFETFYLFITLFARVYQGIGSVMEDYKDQLETRELKWRYLSQHSPFKLLYSIVSFLADSQSHKFLVVMLQYNSIGNSGLTNLTSWESTMKEKIDANTVMSDRYIHFYSFQVNSNYQQVLSLLIQILWIVWINNNEIKYIFRIVLKGINNNFVFILKKYVSVLVYIRYNMYNVRRYIFLQVKWSKQFKMHFYINGVPLNCFLDLLLLY